MEKELLKREVIKETKEAFQFKRSFNIETIVQLFFDIISLPISDASLNLEALDSRMLNAMNKILVEGVKNENRETFFADFAKLEPFLRKILYLVNPISYSQIKNNNSGLIPIIIELDLNPNRVRLDQIDLKQYENDNDFIDHLARAYRFKNLESHEIKELSTKEFGLHTQSFLVVYLHTIHKWQTQLRGVLKEYELNLEPSFLSYCDTVINDFKSRMGRFIHLSSKEDITLSASFVIEHSMDIDKGLNELNRIGTVDELRSTKVPEKRMIIWGEAGMGKSTTLEYLAYKDAIKHKSDKNSNIPVYIQLGLLTDSLVSLKNFIGQKLAIEKAYLEQILDRGKLNIFLDGLNEIPKDNNNQLRTLRLREIDELIKKHKKTFFIISNRPQTVNFFSDVPVFVLEKMSDRQVSEFISKYSDGNKVVESKISERISIDERLKKIIRTPLMLSRLIEIVKADGAIPENEGKIIDRFLKSLYKREIIEKKDANFNELYIHKMLSFLGYYSLEEKDTNAGMRENEILNQFVKCKKEYGFDIDVGYVLDISLQLNIIEKRENMYAFAHQSYQDYYSMEYENIVMGL